MDDFLGLPTDIHAPTSNGSERRSWASDWDPWRDMYSTEKRPPDEDAHQHEWRPQGEWQQQWRPHEWWSHDEDAGAQAAAASSSSSSREGAAAPKTPPAATARPDALQQARPKQLTEPPWRSESNEQPPAQVASLSSPAQLASSSPPAQLASSSAKTVPPPPPPVRDDSRPASAARNSSRSEQWRPRGGKNRGWYAVFHALKKQGETDEAATKAANAACPQSEKQR